MQGYAFRCDLCKRTTFVPEYLGGVRINPPTEWFMVTQAMQDDLAWPTFHFCQFACLVLFVNQSAKEPDVDTDAEVLLADPPDEPGETTLSEWSVDE